MMDLKNHTERLYSSLKGRVTHNDILRIFCKYTELFNFKNI